MELIQLYKTIIGRNQIYYRELKPGQRIAVVMPDGELDVMKIGDLGNATLLAIDSTPRTIAVAKICPGQPSVRLSEDGSLHLNNLVEVAAYIPEICPTKDYLERRLGPLKNYRKAHWVYIYERPIVHVTKQEMREVTSHLPKEVIY